MKLDRLLGNARFWILAGSVVLSVNMAGFVQLLMPPGPLQTIRLEQLYGFSSLGALYLTLLATPLTQVWPGFGFTKAYLHARRALGVAAFYFAVLHVSLTFFGQLGGFAGVKYLNARYSLAVVLGLTALIIMLLLTATSFDWMVTVLGLGRLRWLHRLVYVAGLAVLAHVVIIGPHFTTLSVLGVVIYGAVALLVALEGIRLWRAARR